MVAFHKDWPDGNSNQHKQCKQHFKRPNVKQKIANKFKIRNNGTWMVNDGFFAPSCIFWKKLLSIVCDLLASGSEYSIECLYQPVGAVAWVEGCSQIALLQLWFWHKPFWLTKTYPSSSLARRNLAIKERLMLETQGPHTIASQTEARYRTQSPCGVITRLFGGEYQSVRARIV